MILKKHFLNYLPQIVAITFITATGLYAFDYFIAKKYIPVTVSIEMKSPQDDVCQLFYGANRGFSEVKSQKKSYQGSDFFHKITFELPNEAINYVRIDPGEKPGAFEIKKIEIRAGKQIKEFSGEELKASFSFINLSINESPSPETAFVSSSNNHDSQIHFIQPLDKSFDIVESKSFTNAHYLIALTYVILITLLVLWGKRMWNFLIVIKERLWRISWPINVEIRPFTIAVAVLICLKLVLVSEQQMTALTHTVHDCALFIKLAYSLSNGDWLGTYDVLTLIKGFGYSLFIAITNFLGIPLFLAENILYALAVLFAVKALSPLINNPGWRFAFFVVLFFNPVSSQAFVVSILRDGFYYTLSLVLVAGFAGIYLRRKNGYRNIFRWSVITGIVFFVHNNTREEGIILLPLLLLLSILSLVPLVKTPEREKRLLSSFAILLPYAILISGNIIVASVNHKIYGSYVRNEIKSDAFSDAYAALTKIETDDWFINVPVTKEARMKAYEVSPGFAQLEKYFEIENNFWATRGTGAPGEIKGGWFMWAFRDAAKDAGFHQSLPQSQAFYRQVAEDINAAFETGRLKKKNNIAIFAFAWDNRIIAPFLQKTKNSILFVVQLKGYNAFPRKSVGDEKAIARFQNITNEIANVNTIEEINQLYPTRIKFKTLDFIAGLYQKINPYVFIITVLLYLTATFLMIFPKTRKIIFIHWIIASIFLYPMLMRIFLISFISVSQWEATGMRYLGEAYPFMLAFEGWVIFATFSIISKLNQKRLNLFF